MEDAQISASDWPQVLKHFIDLHHEWKLRVDKEMVSEIVDKCQSIKRPLLVLRDVAAHIYGVAFEDEEASRVFDDQLLSRTNSQQTAELVVLIAKNSFTAQTWKKSIRDSVAQHIAQYVPSQSPDPRVSDVTVELPQVTPTPELPKGKAYSPRVPQPSSTMTPQDTTNALLAELVRALSQQQQPPQVQTPVQTPQAPAPPAAQKSTQKKKCGSCKTQPCICHLVVSTKRQGVQQSTPAPIARSNAAKQSVVPAAEPAVVINVDGGSNDDEESEEVEENEEIIDVDEYVSQEQDEVEEIHEAPAVLSNPKFLLDANHWPALVTMFSAFRVLEALKVYYSDAISRRTKEAAFMFEMMTPLAEIIAMPSLSAKVQSALIKSIDRAIVRLEYFRALQSQGQVAADTVESSLLDTQLPLKFRKARKEGSKRQAESAAFAKQGKSSNGTGGRARGRGRGGGRGRGRGRGETRADGA